MITGFNTDFKFKGTVYHVQTEDNGVSNPVIVTLLYQGGAILASRKTSYADIIKFEKLEKVVKQLMEEQHKQIIKDLVGGKFSHEAGMPSGEVAVQEVKAEPAKAGFGSDVISDKSLDEVILDYLSGEDK